MTNAKSAFAFLFTLFSTSILFLQYSDFNSSTNLCELDLLLPASTLAISSSSLSFSAILNTLKQFQLRDDLYLQFRGRFAHHTLTFTFPDELSLLKLRYRVAHRHAALHQQSEF